MHACFLKETNQFSKLKLFLFFCLGIKKVMNTLWVNKKEIHIFYIPLLKNKKKYQKIITYLKKSGIKKVCADSIKDEVLLDEINKNFQILQGEKVFSYFFEEIIDKFMKKNSLLYEESEISLISDEPLHVKKYLEKIVKKFKKVSIYTSQKEKFYNLAEELLKTYGTTLLLKDKQDQPKKYKRIYINLENKNIFSKNFFQNVSIIDVFKKYENGFHEVLFKMPFEKESFLKEHKISKNLCFYAYLIEKSKINLQKEYKIVNIRKI